MWDRADMIFLYFTTMKNNTFLLLCCSVKSNGSQCCMSDLITVAVAAGCSIMGFCQWELLLNLVTILHAYQASCSR